MKLTKAILALLLIAVLLCALCACPGPAETPDGDELCDVCGKDPCVCPPDNTCDVCGKDPCVCPSDNACDVCGKDPCVCPPDDGGHEGGEENPGPGEIVAEVIPETETAKITGHKGKFSGKLEIPAEVTIGGKTYPVVEIGADAFKANPDVTEIVIPDTVLVIGKGAFRGADGVISLTLPFIGGSAESNTYIGYIFGASSFAENALYTPHGLAEVSLSDACTSIADFAFDYCASLKSVSIGKNVTYIGACAFNGCALKNIVVPDSVLAIGKGAFAKCPVASLTLPFVGADPTGEVGYLGHVFGASSYTENSRFVPAGFSDLTITSVCTVLGEGAFYDCESIVNPQLPASVVSVGAKAFANTAFYRAQPDGLVYVGDVLYAFKGEMTDTNIVVRDGTIAIASEAFGGYPITSISIPESVGTIGQGAFAGSALSEIELSFVGENAAAEENGHLGFIFGAETPEDNAAAIPATLKTVTLRPACERLASRAFYACVGLETVEIGSGVTTMAQDAFGGCTKLSTIRVNEDNTSFKNVGGLIYNTDGNELYAVPGAITGRVELLDVTEIAPDMFRGYAGITEVVLPETLVSIGNGAFADTAALATLDFPDSLSLVGSGAFDGSKWLADQANGLIYANRVLCGFKGEVTPGVNDQVVIREGTVSISAGAFANKQITTAVIPATVKAIGEMAFVGCPLTTLTVPFVGSGSAEIPYLGYLFGSPSAAESSAYIPAGLVKVTVLEGCAELGAGAFSGCRNVAEIELPNSIGAAAVDCLKDTAWLKNHKPGVVYAGRVAYSYVPHSLSYKELMDKIQAGEETEDVYNIVLRADTVAINDNAFAEAPIRSIMMPDTVTYIGNRSFYKCATLTSVRMSSNLETLNSYAFYGCTVMSKIYVPGTVSTISDNVFNGCSSLSTVVLGNGVSVVGKDAFKSCHALEEIKCMFGYDKWTALQKAPSDTSFQAFIKDNEVACSINEAYVNPPYEA